MVSVAEEDHLVESYSYQVPEAMILDGLGEYLDAIDVCYLVACGRRIVDHW